MQTQMRTSKAKNMIVFTILTVILAGCGSSPDNDGWKTKAIRENGTVAGIPFGVVLVGDPQELAGQIQIRMVDRLCEKSECRIVAVDKEGRIRLGEKTAKLIPGGKCRSTTIVFSDIKLDDIKEFRFQGRSYRQETAQEGKKTPLANAVRKAQLIDAAYKGNLFESNQLN
jgi:hypothetical protein